MVLLQVMYTDLDFIATFNIEPEVLQQFLYEVYRRYNNIPFHNFKHCFCVTQMVSQIVYFCLSVCDSWRINPFLILISDSDYMSNRGSKKMESCVRVAII